MCGRAHQILRTSSTCATSCSIGPQYVKWRLSKNYSVWHCCRRPSACSKFKCVRVLTRVLKVFLVEGDTEKLPSHFLRSRGNLHMGWRGCARCSVTSCVRVIGFQKDLRCFQLTLRLPHVEISRTIVTRSLPFDHRWTSCAPLQIEPEFFSLFVYLRICNDAGNQQGPRRVTGRHQRIGFQAKTKTEGQDRGRAVEQTTARLGIQRWGIRSAGPSAKHSATSCSAAENAKGQYALLRCGAAPNTTHCADQFVVGGHCFTLQARTSRA